MAFDELFDEDGDYCLVKEPKTSCGGCLLIIGIIIYLIYLFN